MTTYYVRKTGSDAADGLSASTAWQTIGKVLGAAGIASGDTVYVGAGTYREVVTVNMTSAVAETSIIADVDGSHTGDVGEVIWTAYLTNDTSAPSGSVLLNINGRDYLTFQGFTIIGGSTTVITATTSNSTNLTLRNCVIECLGRSAFSYTGLADVASVCTVDRCIFVSSTALSITLPTSASADYDSNFQVTNCLFIGESTNSVSVVSSGANAFKGGGVDVFNCTFLGKNAALVTGANLSTSMPCTIYNSVMHTNATAINANASGQITEDYNVIFAATPRANVSAGAASISGNPPTYAFLLEYGQAILRGAQPRPYLMPMASSPLLGFGNQAGGPTVDFLNRPRPAGGASTSNAIGYLERHDTAVKETTTVRTGTNAISITGPGDHDFSLAVDATATTVSVYGQYDTNHAATNKPQMSIVNGTECGVADATATMTVGTDTWEQMSLSFTPTAKGIITIRLISRASAGTGKAFFDDFAVVT